MEERAVEPRRRGKSFWRKGFIAGMEPPMIERSSSRTHHMRAVTVFTVGKGLVGGCGGTERDVLLVRSESVSST